MHLRFDESCDVILELTDHLVREGRHLPYCPLEIVETRASVELVRSPDLADRAPYAYAAVAHGVTRLVFTAGACPLDSAGNTAAVGDVAGQAEQVMANLEVALRAAGAELADVV